MIIPITSYPLFVNHYSRYFKDIVGSCLYDSFKSYLTGLIILSKHRISDIANISKLKISYEQLQYFLSDSDFDYELLNQRRINLLENNPKTSSKTEQGIGIVDDSLSHKTGLSIEAVGKHFDHCQHKYTLAHNIVTSHFLNSRTDWPINLTIYQKYADLPENDKSEFKTKIQIAKEHISYAQKQNIKIKIWIFDSWFLCKELIEHIGDSADWISVLKSNRKFRRGNQIFKVSQYAEELKETDFQEVSLKAKKYLIHHLTADISKLGRAGMFFIKNSLEDKNITVLVTNRTDWEAVKAIKTYLKRWQIENFYRAAKQNLGLEEYMVRKLDSAQRHMHLTFLAYSLLELKRQSSRLNKSFNYLQDTVGNLCKNVNEELLHGFISWIRRQLILNHSTEQIIQLLRC